MEMVARAGAFVEAQGREIERARFAYHFGEGSLERVIEALAAYQNPDGGFGNALEPDIKAPDSNPFATELALLICIQAGMRGDEPLLQRTVAHLEATQHEDGDWRFAPGVYEHELAPWFAAWEWPSLNPGCTTVGLLRELGLGSAELHARAERLFERLAKVEDCVSGGFYGVRPYAFYFNQRRDHPQRDVYISGVLWWLIRQHLEGGDIDGGHFFEYARTPETWIGHNLPPAIVQERLDGLLAEQQEDGGWPTPYDPAWRGWTTMQNLLILRAWGRC
ncbi:MAG TPA: hypothetical protein VMM78_01410 [Thermomicrobiales bacterium]|nr:hypothetical protein [Thermomicrobiales bacterium]